ncbi:DUF707 domain-containing protein [Sutcliffiella horikoshii]|uniref:DUF707 domain-containing protein n=1 Tax=Sutcliffiella horikoshii TaxID=79883 RepID=UPI001F41E188|nr:DUF707 domain-containing protein [Sutcliffiella horikoshii]MCG1020136.1 DUF707 domain-containing protein [Sutcliffiella horikoshii]
MFTSKNMNKHRFLIIARVGDTSYHREWLKPSIDKNFDLCLSYYGDSPEGIKNEADFYFESKGTKWPKIKEVIKALGERINQYDAIWLPDDDILTNSSNIKKMFELFTNQQFELAQPALTKDSFFSHAVTTEQTDYLWRYTEFVEIMAPIFSRNALNQCWETFDISLSGWGLDLLWPKLLGYPHKKIAIIDDTSVQHTRPIGTGGIYKYFSPFEELHDLEKKFDVTWLTYQSLHYDGVLKPKRMFILVTAHENEEVLKSQIENIKYFNPEAGIILYNGGDNKEFAKNLNIPICPYSRKIKWAAQARVLWDTMNWLEETDVEYEYLVNFDHDMLFIKQGFEKFLDYAMKDYDCLGWQMLKGSNLSKFPDYRVPKSLWKEWNIWRRVFGVNNFLRYFNPGQTYRKRIATKMIRHLTSNVSRSELDSLFENTKVYGFEEMFTVTLALSCGGKCGEYPDGNVYNEAVRWGNDISLEEVQRVINHPSYYFIHPIKYKKLIKMSNLLKNY